MCGIAGLAPPPGESDGLSSVLAMTGSLARRGPDGEGVWSWPSVILGHRRLAIFDLSSAGNQPMLDPEGQVGIVFNGAIYNFPELREELSTRGRTFRSRTDTEVLLNGYLEWGMDGLLERILGMFAFALWDDRSHQLFLVRDRLGVKPLLFCERGGSIAFASTARALKAGGYTTGFDELAALEYLRFGFVPDDASIYRGVEKVQAATVIEWRNGRRFERTYWEPPAAGSRGRISFSEAVDETERLLLDAVRVRLKADVPVGALLSGGIDSSLICWAIVELGGDVTAYTIGTPGDPWDETAAASETARRLGVKHRVLEMSDEEPLDVDELLSAYAEPFASPSALGMLRVSRAVASSAKVLLTGDGGDDVFLGYPRHRHLALAGTLSKLLPKPLRTGWMSVSPGFPRLGPFRRAASLLDYASGGLDAYLDAAETIPGTVPGLLGPRLLEKEDARPRSSTGIPASRALPAFLDHERRTQFVSEYMTKVDGATMHYGLEARSPFLDQRLWELASSLPVGVRMRRYRLKAILREIARRRIGAKLARGRKRGFGVPVQRWISGRWRERLLSTLRDSTLVRAGWVNPGPLRTLIRTKPATSEQSELAWRLFVLESWLARESQGLPARAAAGNGLALAGEA